MTATPTPDAAWLRKLIAACDDAIDRLPDEPGLTMLHADIVSLRADLRAQLAGLDAEDAA